VGDSDPQERVSESDFDSGGRSVVVPAEFDVLPLLFKRRKCSKVKGLRLRVFDKGEGRDLRLLGKDGSILLC
jgi:hypothetical protein